MGGTQKLGVTGQNLQEFGSLYGQSKQDTDVARKSAIEGANNLGTNFTQYTPNLGTNFQTKIGGDQLDNFSNNLLGRTYQDSATKLNTTNKDIASRFRPGSPIASILQSQAAFSTGLNNNQNPFLAALSQRQREGEEGNFANNALNTINQTKLAQQGASNQGQSLTNSAIAQKVGMTAMPAQLSQNLAALYNEYLKTIGNAEVTDGPDRPTKYNLGQGVAGSAVNPVGWLAGFL